MNAMKPMKSLLILILLCMASGCQQTSHIYQKIDGYADLDIMLVGSNEPAFRVLLPELIWIDGKRYFCHTTPGRWHRTANQLWGAYKVADNVEILAHVVTGNNEIHVQLKVINQSDHDLHDVWIECCANLNHLRGNYGWCNRQFIPSEVPLVRSEQGDYWYDQLTPKHLFALTDDGWVPMHPHPDNPDHRQVPKYSFVPGPKPNAHACAVQSPDEKAWFFQAWNTKGYYCTPCPGNACMHLRPLIAETFKSDDSVCLEGVIGIYQGNRVNLTQKINNFWNQR